MAPAGQRNGGGGTPSCRQALRAVPALTSRWRGTEPVAPVARFTPLFVVAALPENFAALPPQVLGEVDPLHAAARAAGMTAGSGVGVAGWTLTRGPAANIK